MNTRILKIVDGLNIGGYGLEIGPSHNPVLPKSRGYNIKILDHDTQENLIVKYRNLGISEEKLQLIEPVDFIWRGEPLSKLIGTSKFDYIIASHVIEHTPDFISFLVECSNMLKDDGVLSLVVPDMRYCFDFLRPLTSTGDVLQAYFLKCTKPLPGKIFEHFSMTAFRGGCHTWSHGNSDPITFVTSLDEAWELTKRSALSEEYIDIHNWVFNPSSFRLIVNDLNSIGILNINVISFQDTIDYEFFVKLSKSKNPSLTNRLNLASSMNGLI